MSYRGRIAPSPTGYLHLGHARTFLIAAKRAQQHGGTLILRNEDLDKQSSRPEFVRAMTEDLAWLDFKWQEGPQPDGTEPGNAGPYTQSQRSAHYAAALQRLRAMGANYSCVCSRRDLHAAVQAPHAEDDDEPLYPGTCRLRVAEEGQPTAWRFRVPHSDVCSL
jgi:glutamyl/glutaminyl-tRNA synthetase